MKTLFTTIFALAIALPGFSQTEIRQYKIPATPIATGYDVKNYSIEPLPQDSVDVNNVEDYIMSGTLFEDGHINNNTPPADRRVGRKIHFMRVGAQGAVKLSVTYDDPNFYDERSVDIVPFTNSESIIVAVVRDNVYWQARVKVLIVNNTTGVISRDMIFAWGPQSGMNRYSLYPMHAIYKNNKIYFCGLTYVAPNDDTAAWDWAGHNVTLYSLTEDKTAFVGMYDLSTPPGIGPWIDSYNFIYPLGTPYTSYDFDMAIRLKALSNGNIAVIGSCNTLTSDVPSQPASGTLVFMVDNMISSAGPILHLTDNTYYNAGSQKVDDDKYEFGFDVQEADNGYFVYSNKFVPLNFHATYPIVSYIPLDFNVPSLMNTARVHIYPTSYPFLYPSTQGGSGWTTHGWAWGSKLIQPFGSSLTDGVGIHLSGLMNAFNDGSGCWNSSGISSNGKHGPDNYNYLPFIAKLNTAWDGNTISSSIDYWKIYETNNYKFNNNLYGVLGGGLYNTAWPTTFATDNLAYSNDMVFVAPAWNLDPVPDRLNLKFVHTDNAGDIDPYTNNCDKTYINCIPTHQDIVDMRNGIDSMQIDVFTLFTHTTDGESIMDVLSVDDQIACSGNGYFKTNSITKINNNVPDMDLYPNPAREYFNVELRGNIDASAKLSIGLFALTGQKLATLYEGNAQNLKARPQIILPSIATGIYIVKVWTNGILSGQHKLRIQ